MPDVHLPLGWKLDEDGLSRPSDPRIGHRPRIGFDYSTFPSSPAEGLVYVREAAHAVALDAKVLPR